jgi:DNA repair protein RecO (recombination protein O)
VLCVGSRQRLAPVVNDWSAGAGGVLCPACRAAGEATRPLTPNAVKLLRLLLHGRYEHVARVSIEGALADELERAMREYVRWVLEREVRSAAFMDAVRSRRSRARRPGSGPDAAEVGAPGVLS